MSKGKKGRKSASKWEHFERLVAAIHHAASQGATVQWNEKINGRQFDVTIRFRNGLHDYLTVVECKHYRNPVPVDKVEAFITKARDVHANKAVMASASSYQEGALAVAKKHDVVLLTVEEIDTIDYALFGVTLGEQVDALHIAAITLEYTGGKCYKLAEEGDVLKYYAKHIIIEYLGERIRLSTVLDHYKMQLVSKATEVYASDIIRFCAGSRVIAPDDATVPLGFIAALHVNFALTKAQMTIGPCLFEPYLIIPSVEVMKAATGESFKFSRHTLPLGLGTNIQPGKFYVVPQIHAYYYCDSIEGESIKFHLVESFQHGELCQATVKQKREDAIYYVEVTDEEVVLRLQGRLETFRAWLKRS